MKSMCELSGQHNAICEKPRRYPRPSLHLLRAALANIDRFAKLLWLLAICLLGNGGSKESGAPETIRTSDLCLRRIAVHSSVPLFIGIFKSKRRGT